MVTEENMPKQKTRPNKVSVLLFVVAVFYTLFVYNQSGKNAEIAQVYKAERDFLLLANKCPQPLRIQIHAGMCLNTKAERHDRDLHISQLKTAANDTVAFAPLCQSCFEKLSVSQRWPFYEKLIGLYEHRNRQGIEAQIKRGL